jgi:hypothetical protein
MVVYAIHYSNPSLRQAQDKLAQGDNHSEIQRHCTNNNHC